jgi:hypothetical protein
MLLVPHMRYMPCPSHPPCLGPSNYIWQRLQVMELLIIQFSHPPTISSLYGPNILLGTPFSNAVSLCSSLIVRDQVSTHTKTTGKSIVLYILIFTFLDSRRETKGSGLNGNKHYPNLKRYNCPCA